VVYPRSERPPSPAQAEVAVKCTMCHSKRLATVAMPMLILLPLLLLCYGVGNVCSTVHENSRDLQALLDFKQGVSDPSGALSNWTRNTHFCRWTGITCTLTRRPLRVLSLTLRGKNLAGKISSSLGNLTFLGYLDLSSNNFVSPLPDALTNCPNLYYLDLSSNLLSGSIPPQLGLLSNLKYLSLHSNKFEASIPGELGQLVNLQSLLLNENSLSGEIPHAIFNNLSSLQYLYLHSNSLGKALPSNIGELLPHLIELALENNTFEGPIPASLGNSALGLQVIDLSWNNFTGKIPTSFGNLSSLTFLSLQKNNLVARDDQDWEFLNTLRNCKSLKTLSLSFNKLQGSIPLSIGNLSTSLQHLLLGGNSLSGQVPQSIGKLSGLIRLGLDDNYLSGTIEGSIEN